MYVVTTFDSHSRARGGTRAFRCEMRSIVTTAHYDGFWFWPVLFCLSREKLCAPRTTQNLHFYRWRKRIGVKAPHNTPPPQKKKITDMMIINALIRENIRQDWKEDVTNDSLCFCCCCCCCFIKLSKQRADVSNYTREGLQLDPVRGCDLIFCWPAWSRNNRGDKLVSFLSTTLKWKSWSF